MLALHCCKILPDGKAPCSELMLHHTMNVQVLAEKCCKYRAILQQILRSLEIPKANDQNIVHRYFRTEALSHRHVFTQTFAHTHAFTQGRFYTQGCFYAPNFYTQTDGYFYTRVPLHSDAFTEECFYTHVLLHRASFNTN